ncbi:hypothetical protein [Jiangella asiatica]|uniref:Septum formation-related domain-containing protein n=1 Tax=Jiangella asiatica TaxID=2530372 RepID=A0A4R5CN95_9ACTN|nr:hypothetical protein [Jiangella asiatica]TDD99044.1 hypothetical protein E1269_27820 [Jiangella asiatica]
MPSRTVSPWTARESAPWPGPPRSEPPWPGPLRPGRALPGIALVFLALALGACGGSTHKDETLMDAQTTGVLDIEGGECFSDPRYSAAAAEEVVLFIPCEDGADNQSYSFVHAPDGPWDRDEVAALGWAGCGDEFAQRWSSVEESGLDFYPILPTEQTWADGDRVIMCAVYDPDGQLSGSTLPTG